MIFYISPKGTELLDYMADYGDYIGSLNINNPEARPIKKEDISLDQIQKHLKLNEVLIAIIFFINWEVGIVAINSDAFNVIKEKHKQRRMLWYWLPLDRVKESMPNMQFKDLKHLIENNK